MSRLILLLSSLLLAGCLDEKALVQKFVPKEDDAFARHFVELVKDKRYVEAETMLDESVRAQRAGELRTMQVVVDHGQPVSFETIGSNVGFFKPWDGPAKRQVSLVYQIQFPDAWVVAEMLVESSGDVLHIKSANFQPIPDSLEVLNRFTFENKSIVHYFTFLACILVPVFIIVTIVVCIRSRVRRRWLWIIFIAIGLGQFELNWTSGVWSIQPISFSLLGAACFRPGLYGPWLVKFSVPVGALVFWMLRSRLRRKGDPPSPPTAPA